VFHYGGEAVDRVSHAGRCGLDSGAEAAATHDHHLQVLVARELVQDCRVGIDDGGVGRNGGDANDVASAPAGGMVERHAYSALRRGAVETAFPLSVPVSRAFSETLPDFQADDSDGEAVGIEVQHHEVRLERVDGGLGGVNGIGPERYEDDVLDFPAFFGAGVE